MLKLYWLYYFAGFVAPLMTLHLTPLFDGNATKFLPNLHPYRDEVKHMELREGLASLRVREHNQHEPII